MSFEHPMGIDPRGYFRLNDVCIGWTWRAGCTSIIRTMEERHEQKGDVDIIIGTPQDDVVHLFLKNPLDRYRSAWIAQPVKGYPGEQTPRRPDMEEFTDGVMDDIPGWRSPHTEPQLLTHQACKKLQVWRLENSTHVCGIPLKYLNITTEDKPLANYRIPDLLDYYAQDIQAWEDAVPCQIV